MANEGENDEMKTSDLVMKPPSYHQITSLKIKNVGPDTTVAEDYSGDDASGGGGGDVAGHQPSNRRRKLARHNAPDPIVLRDDFGKDQDMMEATAEDTGGGGGGGGADAESAINRWKSISLPNGR